MSRGSFHRLKFPRFHGARANFRDEKKLRGAGLLDKVVNIQSRPVMDSYPMVSTLFFLIFSRLFRECVNALTSSNFFDRVQIAYFVVSMMTHRKLATSLLTHFVDYLNDRLIDI